MIQKLLDVQWVKESIIIIHNFPFKHFSKYTIYNRSHENMNDLLKNIKLWGILWWPSGQDSRLSLQRPRFNLFKNRVPISHKAQPKQILHNTKYTISKGDRIKYQK